MGGSNARENKAPRRRRRREKRTRREEKKRKQRAIGEKRDEWKAPREGRVRDVWRLEGRVIARREGGRERKRESIGGGAARHGAAYLVRVGWKRRPRRPWRRTKGRGGALGGVGGGTSRGKEPCLPAVRPQCALRDITGRSCVCHSHVYTGTVRSAWLPRCRRCYRQPNSVCPVYTVCGRKFKVSPVPCPGRGESWRNPVGAGIINGETTGAQVEARCKRERSAAWCAT